MSWSEIGSWQVFGDLMLEVQRGEYLGEDYIVRFEDVYGRVTSVGSGKFLDNQEVNHNKFNLTN
jgi:hypothetical protein